MKEEMGVLKLQTAPKLRLLSQDPIGHDSGDDNYYRYAGNNPLLYTDPEGTEYGVCPTDNSTDADVKNFQAVRAFCAIAASSEQEFQQCITTINNGLMLNDGQTLPTYPPQFNGRPYNPLPGMLPPNPKPKRPVHPPVG